MSIIFDICNRLTFYIALTTCGRWALRTPFPMPRKLANIAFRLYITPEHILSRLICFLKKGEGFQIKALSLHYELFVT